MSAVAQMQKPVPIVEMEIDRELHHRLRVEEATAVREAEEARLDHHRKGEVCIELERSGVLLSENETSGRTLRSVRSRGERLSTPEEREVALTKAKDECLKAARRLTAAREGLRCARVALAAYELPELLAEHDAAVGRVREADKAAEAAYVAIASTLIARDEARAAEAAKARAVVHAVNGTLLDDESRTYLRDRARDEVPAALDSDGEVTTWRDRPTSGLFQLGGQSWESRNDRFFESLADIVRGGRARVGGTCGSVAVAEKIKKALGDERD